MSQQYFHELFNVIVMGSFPSLL
eukprot:UN20167